jgi:cyclase
MSLHSRIFPVLLIRDHGLVKTRRFGEDRYVGDPINAVKIFNEKEVDELAIFDIDATVAGREPDFAQLEKIAVESRMPLCYGGGVTSAEQAARLVSIGYEKVSISSAAIARPQLISETAERIGRQSVVVTVDVRKEGLLGRHTVYTCNGRRKEKIDALDFIAEAERLGVGEIAINSIDRDGMMDGYDIKFAKAARERVTTPLSLVGGAGSVDHMAALIDAVGTVGAGAGSMFVFKGPFRAVLISYDRPGNAREDA